MTAKTGYPIRTMAKRCAMSTHTLRYYERIGLIQPIGRASNGHRFYSDADERWLKFLRWMRETGMSIRDMQSYVAQVQDGDESAQGRRRAILEHHRVVLERQIADLQKAHASLLQTMEHPVDIEAGNTAASGVAVARRPVTTEHSSGLGTESAAYRDWRAQSVRLGSS